MYWEAVARNAIFRAYHARVRVEQLQKQRAELLEYQASEPNAYDLARKLMDANKNLAAAHMALHTAQEENKRLDHQSDPLWSP